MLMLSLFFFNQHFFASEGKKTTHTSPPLQKGMEALTQDQ